MSLCYLSAEQFKWPLKKSSQYLCKRWGQAERTLIKRLFYLGPQLTEASGRLGGNRALYLTPVFADRTSVTDTFVFPTFLKPSQ